MCVAQASSYSPQVFKTEGNAHLNAKNYTAAIASYTQAIAANSNNHIYFANRALAHIELAQFDAAVQDSEASIRIDETYSKGHYRLGLALMGLKKFPEAVAALQAALMHNTGDASHIEAKLAQAQTAMGVTPAAKKAPAAAANPFANLASMFGGAGGGGGGNPFGGLDLGALMSNPAIAQMATQMAQNPAALQSLMAGLGGMGGMGGMGGAPAAAEAAAGPADGLADTVAQFLDSPEGVAMAQDPVMAPVVADIRANGVGAAMKYASNPAVMAKLSALMGQQ